MGIITWTFFTLSRIASSGMLQVKDKGYELTKKKIQVNIFPRKNILVLEYEKGGNHELC